MKMGWNATWGIGYFYTLDANRQPVRCNNAFEWADWMNKPENRVVAQIRSLDDKVFISTIFTGLDANFSGVGPPLFFETTIYDRRGKEEHRYCALHHDWDTAIAVHRLAVREILGGIAAEEGEEKEV